MPQVASAAMRNILVHNGLRIGPKRRRYPRKVANSLKWQNRASQRSFAYSVLGKCPARPGRRQFVRLVVEDQRFGRRLLCGRRLLQRSPARKRNWEINFLGSDTLRKNIGLSRIPRPSWLWMMTVNSVFVRRPDGLEASELRFQRLTGPR